MGGAWSRRRRTERSRSGTWCRVHACSRIVPTLFCTAFVATATAIVAGDAAGAVWFLDLPPSDERPPSRPPFEHLAREVSVAFAAFLLVQRRQERQEHAPQLHRIVGLKSPGLRLDKSKGNSIGSCATMREDPRGAARRPRHSTSARRTRAQRSFDRLEVAERTAASIGRPAVGTVSHAARHRHPGRAAAAIECAVSGSRGWRRPASDATAAASRPRRRSGGRCPPGPAAGR
jgi:hypothetical protein